jgi:outer membrane protein assembly factor BamB
MLFAAPKGRSMRARLVLHGLGWVTVLCVLGVVARADNFEAHRSLNWHQWRGPEATGAAPHGNPPLRWSETTNIRWKVPIAGRGLATPIVWGQRIFVLTAIRTERTGQQPPMSMTTRPTTRDTRPTHVHQFVVLCLDRSTGQVLWQRVACEALPHQGHHKTSSFANASPITDGRFVYCSFGSRGVYCYDMDGNLRWQADLGALHIKFGFGEGCSPALFGDTLVVKCDQEEGESFITALDATSGKPKWRTVRNEKTTWNTPLITEHNGRAQVITTGGIRARSYDLSTGQLIWEYGAQNGNDAIPSPLRLGDLAVCIGGLRGNPAFGIPLGATGDLTSSDRIVWKHARGTPQISSPVLVGERLWFIRGRDPLISCISARTGEIIFDQMPLPGLKEIYASPVAAAGRVYFSDRNGATVVLDANADEVKVLSENRLDEPIDASPAIVGRELFIRGDATLYCISE